MDGIDAYSLIARVTKAQGLHGEVVVVPTDGLPFLLHEGLSVWIVPPTLQGVRHTQVLAIRSLAKGWGIMLGGITDAAAAYQLVGRHLLAATADLPEHKEESSVSLLGLKVKDQKYGDLGLIVDQLQTPAHPLWVVQGPYGEVLIPVVDEFIACFYQDRVEVRLPEGLVAQEPQVRGGES
ncbi:MAG: 16S rRNA processing protein RimM [Coriobacteriaceae bacterium]|nr:16S rRNA processing protein RimM [Coriobacteriaceae bacterium]